jgi:Xaa-Pro aminopeptidase
MAVVSAPYEGDQNPVKLSEITGISQLPGDLRGFLEGVLGTPDGGGDGAWLALLGMESSHALAAQLKAMRDDLASRRGPPAGWSAARVADLRANLAKAGVTGFVVPRADEHQGEYVPKCAERLAWLTGFAGSAGLAIVLADRAAIFTDGRYTLQVRAQVDGTLFEYRHLTDEPPHDWLAEHLKPGDRLGFDPRLHTVEGLQRIRAAVSAADASLVPVEPNPLDAAWQDQPAQPLAPVVLHPRAFAGRSPDEKISQIAAGLAQGRHAAAVISAPESIAWLLNVRGGDVAHTPLPLSYAIVTEDGAVDWFVDRRKLHREVVETLGNRVAISEPAFLGEALDALGRSSKRVLLDSASASVWITERLEKSGAVVARGQDPCALPKACKTADELAHIRAAHVRDGVAVTRFLAWLAVEGRTGRATELKAMEQLEAFRRAGDHFRDTSFTSISGAGPNGAIVHYRSTPETNRRIEPDMLYLIDSGGQYLDGTTDITRTIAIGRPTAEQRDRFTRVLKGHIAIATARIPVGTTGSQIDALARLPLWEAGLDFDHGTGHGVGYYLSVHEGPQRISKLPNTVALQPGMIVSNEPGYYKTGEYGIRIENLVAVREAEAPPGAERKLLDFETLTLAPIDRNLVDVALLSERERGWLNDYHARVRATLTPLVDGETAAWLAQATQPL